jgi:site-specific DNA-cytosine methylase
LSLISLFDGIGGFPLAFSRVGVRTVATVEIDKAAAGVAADHFPEAKCFPDVTEVTPDELLATGFCPVHGVVSAGWPCQGNSVAGKRGGMADPRSGLWRHVVRLQGYPDSWTATSYGRPQSDAPRYRQLGNWIAVPVFAWVARRIVAVDSRPA